MSTLTTSDPPDATASSKPARRRLTFRSLDDVQRDLETLERAHQDGALVAVGGWTPGQNFQHIARLFEGSLDGFDFKAPLSARVMGVLMRPWIAKMRFPSGVKLRGPMTSLEPDADVPFDEGLSRLRRALDRIHTGERMTQPSPLVGRIPHQKWVDLHLRHCELHLSFLVPLETSTTA